MTHVQIAPAAPYSLERTVGAFARFPDERVDLVHPSGFRRAFNTGTGTVLLGVVQNDSQSLSEPVTIRVLASEGTPDVCAAIDSMRRLLAADEHINPVYELMRDIPALDFLADRLRGLRRTIDPTPFEGLVHSVLAQQISIRGAAVVRSRLVERFGGVIEYDGAEYWAFPRPEDVQQATIDELCGLGMTQSKARAIQNIAVLCGSGELELGHLEEKSDGDVIAHLTALPGIGPWTAEWFLVNVLGRMSIVPGGDLGIRRSTGNWLLGGELPSSSEVRRLYEPFGIHRAYVAYYILSAERYKLELPPQS